jgi:hypothetical protein
MDNPPVFQDLVSIPLLFNSTPYLSYLIAPFLNLAYFCQEDNSQFLAIT